METVNTQPSFFDLRDGEEQLVDPDEFHYRQCHPQFFQDGEPSSQLYGDFKRDEGQISGARSTKVSATEAFDNHINSKQLSVGTWALTVAEIEAESSRVVDDTAAPLPSGSDPRPVGHSYLDQQHLDEKGRQRLRRKLIRTAKQRGCVYSPGDGTIRDMVLPEGP